MTFSIIYRSYAGETEGKIKSIKTSLVSKNPTI